VRQHRHRLGVQHQQARHVHNHLWRWTLAVNAMLVAVCAAQARSALTHVLRAEEMKLCGACLCSPRQPLRDEAAALM